MIQIPKCVLLDLHLYSVNVLRMIKPSDPDTSYSSQHKSDSLFSSEAFI